MSSSRVWRGVRMRDTRAGADPDAPARPLTLPAAWDDRAAAALAALAPGDGGTTLPRATAAWIRPVAARARDAGDPALADRLHALLLRRRAAPTEPVWALPLWASHAGTSHAGANPAAAPPGFVLNLPAFHDPAHGFDGLGFAEAVRDAATALRLLAPHAPRFAVGVADLDGLLACLGLDYAGDDARALAATLAALVRATADVALAGEQPDLLSRIPDWPAPPAHCPVPGLSHLARAARAAALRGACALPSTAVPPPGPTEALLGAETGGIAPAFSPVGPDGALTRAARARLAALGLSAEAALALHLSGGGVLAPAGLAAHRAMHDAVAPYIHAMPPRPTATATTAAGGGVLSPRRALPARRRGHTQRASVGGHTLYLRTGEYPDGTPGEIHIHLPRERAALRGALDGVAAAVSLGLQHGVPLADYVAALALTRFGPAGRVEGDPAVARATSILDYVVRTLAARYLGGCPMPEAEDAGDEAGRAPRDAPGRPSADDPAPLLPLDLPVHPRARRLGLRLVANR